MPPRVGDRLLAPGLEHGVHPVNLRSLGVNNPLGKLHDLGGDTLLGQEHLTHLHGLLVMGDHHLGKHDVRVVVIGGDLPVRLSRRRGGLGRLSGSRRSAGGRGGGVGVA